MSRLPWWPILIGLALVVAAVAAGLVLAFGRGGGVAAVRPTPAGPPGRIAYATTRGGLVSIVVADGSGRHARLLDPVPEIQQYQPAWSRGAKLLVYVGLVHGDPSTAEILVSAPSGGSFRQLTRNLWEDDFPTWSPDGRSIAFYSFRPQGAGIYVMDASGRHQRLLAATTDPTSWAPAWAPDGKSIAFIRGVASKAEIYTIQPDGRGLSRLTRNSVFDTDPSWSSDGRRIAFASDRNGRSQIYVMSADGGGLRRLTHDGGVDSHPTWSADGRWIAFTHVSAGGSSRVYLAALDGSEQRPLTGSLARNGSDPALSPSPKG
jgi:tol-pal system beta propeller repeat protein TolB